jgi:hypothetical protein
MKYRVILLRAALPFSLSSETSKPDHGNTLERMCGPVTDSRYTSTPWWSSDLRGARRVKKADVRRYRREGQKCSTQNAPISEMPTGNDGGFEFKDAVPGEDWVFVVVGTEKYKLSVSLAPRAAKESQESRDFVLQINDDELRVLKMYKGNHLEEHAETH